MTARQQKMLHKAIGRLELEGSRRAVAERSLLSEALGYFEDWDHAGPNPERIYRKELDLAAALLAELSGSVRQEQEQ